MKKRMNNEQSKAIALPLQEPNLFDAFTASTMMVIMKKPLKFEAGTSPDPASPGGGIFQ